MFTQMLVQPYYTNRENLTFFERNIIRHEIISPHNYSFLLINYSLINRLKGDFYLAYVDIPKALDGIKSKVALGLTKKQLIGFGIAAVIGVPVYLATRLAVGNDVGLFFMMLSMALPLLCAIYEPKGMTMGQFMAVGCGSNSLPMVCGHTET